jgi:diacylglycerol kinase (ATP)
MRRYLVIWNPTAGEKAGIVRTAIDEVGLRRLMADHGLGSDLVVADDLDAARARVRAAIADGVDVVVAAGGDGTVGMVAHELFDNVTALGILPLGSAMNVARSLGIPRDLEEAARILATGEVARIDMGQVRNERFLEIVSVGINASILKHAHDVAEGSFESVIALLRAVVRYRPTRMTIVLDDQTIRTRSMMVAVANAPFTGLGLTLAPGARMDDGLLDVAVFRQYSKWELLRHLGSIVAGRRNYSPRVRTYRSASIRIESGRPLPARVDERDLGSTPIEVTVDPRCLNVVVARPAERLDPEAGGAALTGSAAVDDEAIAPFTLSSRP